MSLYKHFLEIKMPCAIFAIKKRINFVSKEIENAVEKFDGNKEHLIKEAK